MNHVLQLAQIGKLVTSQTAAYSLANVADADQSVLDAVVIQSKPDSLANWIWNEICTSVTCSDLCCSKQLT